MLAHSMERIGRDTSYSMLRRFGVILVLVTCIYMGGSVHSCFAVALLCSVHARRKSPELE